MDTSLIRRSYGSVADLYIELFGGTDRVDPEDLAFIGRHLGGRTGPVLDLGCGPGHLTAHLRGLGADASGIDLTPEFIDHARATHPGVPYRLGSLADLDVPNGAIAGILAWYSLIHVPPGELPGVLAGFRRVLAPGGGLVLGLFDGADVSAFDHKVTTAYRWPADEVSALLAGLGFTETGRIQRPADDRGRAHLALAFTRAAKTARG